jgi:DNA-directed RNA polymerase subunit beta'
MTTKEAVSVPKAAAHVGGDAIRRLLSKIDIDAELKVEEERAPKLKGSELNRANRKIRILRNLKELNLRPEQAFMLQNIPVIPPKYRPVYPDPSGVIVESPINHLYKNVILVNKALQDSKQLPNEEDRTKARGELHEALRVFQGWTEPTGARKELMRGIFDLVASKGQPKSGYFQSKLLSKRQDVSGRSTIVLNPDLHMDQAGIPEEMAWRIFEPFIVRDLHSTGYEIVDALKLVKDKDPRAQSALNRVVEERPVILNRAPSLHKHSVLAFRPLLIKGLSIELPPLVTKGFNADFDGDTMSVEVPITSEAVAEAMEMMPSRNMLSSSGKILTAPSQSAQLGLYLITQSGKKTGKKFGSDSDAFVAHKKGEIETDDLVTVDGAETTVGRLLVNKILPPKLRDPGIMLDKKKTQKILEDLARNSPQEAPAVAEKLKDLGFRSAYESGFSVGLDDFAVDKKTRDPIVGRIRKEINKVRDMDLPDRERDSRIEKILLAGQTELGAALKKNTPVSNNLGVMVRAGARGEWGQIQQMTSAPVAVEDAMGVIVPSLIETSYAEGLTPGEYWTAMHGARKGMIERTLRTSEPGALNKSLLHTTINYPVTIQDCGTKNGIEMATDNAEIVDRYVAQDAAKIAKAGDLVTPSLADRLSSVGVKTVIMRSPITCEASKGICQLCAGADEYGKPYRIGKNLGAISAQAVTEPATQLSMTTFHTGGIVSGEDRIVDSFKRVRSLMEFPEEFPDKAAISETAGKVESVAEAPIGGWNVRIGGKNHYVAPDRKLMVSQNEGVQRGQKISSGTRDPREMLRVLGVNEMRAALVEDLAEVYKNAGPYVKQKHFETVIRAITDSARIKDSGESDLVPGDIVPYNTVRSKNMEGVKTVQVDDALGTWMSEAVEGIMPDKVLDEADIERLRALGKKSVQANPNPIDYEPVLKGIRTLPLHRRDWLSQLAFTHLKDAIRQGVPEGWRSELHETNPIPGVIYGAEFGMGKFASVKENDGSKEMLSRHLSDARDDV